MKVLITGASGMLGSEVARLFTEREADVYGIQRGKAPRENTSYTEYNLDLTNARDLGAALKAISPELIVHCASLVNVDQCEEKQSYVDQLHAGFTDAVLSSCPQARLIYISTDSVFDGKTGNHPETAKPHPLNYYAKSKVKGEQRLAASGLDHLVLRTNIYGFHLSPGASLVEWALAQLAQGTPINGFHDVKFNPLYTAQLAEIIYAFRKPGQTGILNAASDTFISKYDFLVQLAAAFGFGQQLIVPQSVKTMQFKAERPNNTTLDTSLLKRLTGSVPSLADGIQRLAAAHTTIFNAS